MPHYFIHIADPHFAVDGRDPGRDLENADFPFGRRLGPYLTKKEAVNQAVADIASGMGEGVIGVYAEGASEKTRDGGEAEASETREDLQPLVDAEIALREKIREEQQRATRPEIAEAWDALEEAITNEKVLEIAQMLRNRTQAS